MPAELEEQRVDQSAELDGGVDPNVQQDVQPQNEPQGGQQDDLRSAVSELTRIVTEDKKRASEPKEKEQTPEEQAKAWAIYEPESEDKDFFKKFLRLNSDMDEQELTRVTAEFKPVFAAMQKGLVRQAIVGARNLFMTELEKFKADYEPVRTFAEQQQSEQRKQKFFKSYPALSDERFSKVITAAGSTLSARQFKTEDEYFKALAESAAETIKGVLPEFDLGAKPNKTTQSSARTTPRLPRTNVGGTGGAGGSRSASTEDSKDDSADIF